MHMDREQDTYVHSRKAVEARIEEMITLLDMIDDDPDREEDDAPEDGNDGELCLGWNENVGQVGLGYPTQDGETSLGWRNEGCQAGGFLRASRDDREQHAGDEREFDLDSNEGDAASGLTVDDEPTLGWPNNVGKGAITLTAGWPYQLAGIDGECEPNLAAVRGGQGL